MQFNLFKLEAQRIISFALGLISDGVHFQHEK